jgi:hypothetical protein
VVPYRYRGRKFGCLTICKEVEPEIFHCDCACGNECLIWRSLLFGKLQRNCGMCCCPPWDPRKAGPKINNPGIGYHGHLRRYKTRDGGVRRYLSREFNTWSMMIARCYNEKHDAYPTYGGRGVRVCERWRPGKNRAVKGAQGFKNFLEDMGPRPIGETLDRINPQGHYEPTNCKWANAVEQVNNQRHRRWPRGGGEKMPKLQGVREMERQMAAYEQQIQEELHPY